MPLRPYEVVYIIDPDVNETDTEALVERFRALAETQGAQDLRVDTQLLGRRRLAYVIKHKREGQYVVMTFQSEASVPTEVDRVLRINDSVLRSMVVRLDEMPAEVEAPPPAPAEAVVETVEPVVEATEETPETDAPAAAEEAPATDETPEPEAASEEETPAEETPAEETA